MVGVEVSCGFKLRRARHTVTAGGGALGEGNPVGVGRSPVGVGGEGCHGEELHAGWSETLGVFRERQPGFPWWKLAWHMLRVICDIEYLPC